MVQQLGDDELHKVSELLSQQAHQQADLKETEESEVQEPIPHAEQASNASEVTGLTGITHKTLISSLQRQLGEEKEAREKLESELNKLKTMSQEISQKLEKQGQYAKRCNP